jgi:hypothetical protein
VSADEIFSTADGFRRTLTNIKLLLGAPATCKRASNIDSVFASIAPQIKCL